MQKTLSYAKEITRALDEKLADEKWKVMLFGQDLQDPYGGCFGITKGLSTKYPHQVVNTPISEAAVCGFVTGMAMRGFRPVFEIMFGDFIALCADQIVNHMTKFEWMYNDQVTVPVTIRMPSGGYRGYGPTHSQTLEHMFFGLPNLDIVAPSHFHNVGDLLHTAIESEKPTLFVENKILYTKPLYKFYKHKNMFEINTYKEKYPTVEIKTWCTHNKVDSIPDISIFCYGGTLVPTIAAVCDILDEKDDAAISIVCPSLINADELFPNHIEVGKAIISVEEGYANSGWGNIIHSEVPTEVACQIANLDVPIGDGKSLEDETLVGSDEIADTIRSFL